MGAPIPTLGFPSRTAAAMALEKAGLSRDEIAARIGVDKFAVANLISYGKRAPRRSRPSEKAARTVAVPTDILDALIPAAERRAVSVNQLVRDLLSVIADETSLVDAIMDDEDDRNRE